MLRWLPSLFALVLTAPGFAGPPDVDDVVLTIRARAALYQDDELRPHNIGVRVVGRVATLFGPVAKLDLGLRAESRLRDMIELRDVRNELDVVPAPAPLPLDPK